MLLMKPEFSMRLLIAALAGTVRSISLLACLPGLSIFSHFINSNSIWTYEHQKLGIRSQLRRAAEQCRPDRRLNVIEAKRTIARAHVVARSGGSVRERGQRVAEHKSELNHNIHADLTIPEKILQTGFPPKSSQTEFTISVFP